MSIEASVSTRPVRPQKRRRVIGLVLLILVLLAAVNGIIDYGDREEVCRLCTASSNVREFHVLGLGGDWGRSIEMGRLARFINEHSEEPCQHEWSRWGRESGNALYRTVTFDGGRLTSLYSMMNATNLDLDQMQRDDPKFLQSVKRAVATPWHPDNAATVQLLTRNVVEKLVDTARKRDSALH